MLTLEEKKRIADKFFKDGDWYLVEKMINEYLEPLKDITSIKVDNRTADSVMAELAGKQIAYKELTEFLRDCRILGVIINNKHNSFK